MPTKADLEDEMKVLKTECIGTAARHRLIAEDASKELAPLREKKDSLERRIRILKNTSDAGLLDMGYKSKQDADVSRRGLEAEYAILRVECATREAYWTEEASVWEERNKEGNEKLKDLRARIEACKTPDLLVELAPKEA